MDAKGEKEGGGGELCQPPGQHRLHVYVHMCGLWILCFCTAPRVILHDVHFCMSDPTCVFSVPHVGPGRQLHLHIQRRALALSGQSGEMQGGAEGRWEPGGGTPGRDPRNGAIKTSGGETEVEAHRRVDYRHMRYLGRRCRRCRRSCYIFHFTALLSLVEGFFYFFYFYFFEFV